MMKVCYSEMDTPAGLSCRLEADGHAGYAPAGQDIVCAGASTVMQGLVYLLAGEENAHSEAFDEPDGPRLAVSVDAPCEEWVRGAFELAKACFVLLAERYPENVRFADVSRRGKESMMDLQLFAAEATAACGGNREPRLGQRSDFSKPCQGAAEKSANATRKALTVSFLCGSQRIGMSNGVGCRSEGRQDLNPKLIKFSLRNPCSHDMIKPAWRRISCRIQITNSCPSLFRYIK